MGRGGFPPSETGSFSAHYTATWVDFNVLYPCFLSVVLEASASDTVPAVFPARLSLALPGEAKHLNKSVFPRLFHIGNFYLPTYGVLVATGVLIGLWISVRNSEKQGINGDDAWNLGIFMVLAGIIGAKILYVINDWSTYAQHWREIFSLNTLQAGGVFSGGLIGALLVGAWYMRSHRMPPLRTTDAFAPGLAFGHVLGRLGCFSAGCCFGKPTNHFWGVTFTNPLAYSISGTPLNVRIEPTQLIEAAEIGRASCREEC